MERKKVFFRSHAAGRDFTNEEWTAYCEATWRGQQEPETFTFGEFTFNIHDVCLNPRKAVDFKNAAVQIQVTTAKSPDGRWTAGHSLNAPNFYSGSPAIFSTIRYAHAFQTEAEAVLYELAGIEKQLNRELGEVATFIPGSGDDARTAPEKLAAYNTKRKKILQKALNGITSLCRSFQNRQLSLFPDL